MAYNRKQFTLMDSGHLWAVGPDALKIKSTIYKYICISNFLVILLSKHEIPFNFSVSYKLMEHKYPYDIW
jgi:hypothetical protein